MVRSAQLFPGVGGAHVDASPSVESEGELCARLANHSIGRMPYSTAMVMLYECPECGSEDISVCVPPVKSIAYNLKPSDPDSADLLVDLEDYGYEVA